MLLRSFRFLRGVNTTRRLNPTIHSSVHPKVQITFHSHFSLYLSTPRNAVWPPVALLDVLFVHTIGRCASASSSAAILFRAASRPMLLRSFRCLRGVNTIRRLNPTIHSSVHPKVQITFYSHFSLYFSTSRSALWSSVALLDVLFVHTIGRCASASSSAAIFFSGRFASNAAEELPMSPRREHYSAVEPYHP